MGPLEEYLFTFLETFFFILPKETKTKQKKPSCKRQHMFQAKCMVPDTCLTPSREDRVTPCCRLQDVFFLNFLALISVVTK